MHGTDPAFDAHPTDPWFDGEGDLLRWHEWWIQPPTTAEKAAAWTELAALDRELRRGGAGDLGDWALRLRRVGEVLLAALAAGFADDPTAQHAQPPAGRCPGGVAFGARVSRATF
jgi:hypothetical protein